MYPKFLRLRQRFERPLVDDIPKTTTGALAALHLSERIRPGDTVALTAGSRGIANIPLILRSVAEHLKEIGAKPFIVPAMGSHGGGIAEGQQEVIESYGITEEFTGVPIRASMEVVSLGETAEEFPVVFDRHASEADHIGVVARIKPHTAYHGPIESGLLKMMMIGLGKHEGAKIAHRLLLEHPYGQVVRSISKVMREKAPITFGVGIVENAYDETAKIGAVLPNDFESFEEEMLVLAKKWLPRLPFHEADLLIIDEIGKNISGSGLDTNVAGRKRAFREAPPEGQPQMRYIFVRGLTEKTHGNAAGIGLTDFTTNRLVESMNYKATVINCLTSGYPDGATIPVHLPSDREVIDAALAILGTRSPQDARVMRIRNTLSVETVEVSEPCVRDLPKKTDFQVEGDAFDLTFDSQGNLPDLAH